MRVYISQSNFMPWWGFWSTLRGVDRYVIYDTVQFTRRDWRTRNRIRVQGKVRWLGIPVHGSQSLCINAVEIADPEWARVHVETLRHAYKPKADSPAWVAIRDTYARASGEILLSNTNEVMLRELAHHLGVETAIGRAEEHPHSGSASERLAQIARAVNAQTYLTGPAALAYLDLEPFRERGIGVEVLDFDAAEPPSNRLSILDSLLTTDLASTKALVSQSFSTRSIC